MHTDSRAAESARAVNARAYTVGKDVIFGAGEYAPGILYNIRSKKSIKPRIKLINRED